MKTVLEILTEDGTIRRMNEINLSLQDKDLSIHKRLELLLEDSRLMRRVLTIGLGLDEEKPKAVKSS